MVFEGGGVKGIAYVGAMRELEKRGIVLSTIKRVGGTSAGAINAVLFACGYSVDEMQDELDKKDFNDFKDNSKGVIRDTNRMVKQFGWNKGNEFEKWIGMLIKQKTGSVKTTFKQLQATEAPELYLIATNLSTHFSEKFSATYTPDLEIRRAVRMSMSIPLFFKAVKHRRGKNNPKNKSCVYVDGGVLMNYPVKLFDRKTFITGNKRSVHALARTYYDEGPNKRISKTVNKHVYLKETLGLRLDSKEEIESILSDNLPKIEHNINNILQYSCALVQTIMSAQMNQHVHSDDWQRTIYIDTLGIKTTQFDLSEQEKKDLIKSGVDGVTTYFDWYDDVANKTTKRSCNHPDFVNPA